MCIGSGGNPDREYHVATPSEVAATIVLYPHLFNIEAIKELCDKPTSEIIKSLEKDRLKRCFEDLIQQEKQEWINNFLRKDTLQVLSRKSVF